MFIKSALVDSFHELHVRYGHFTGSDADDRSVFLVGFEQSLVFSAPEPSPENPYWGDGTRPVGRWYLD